MTLQMLHILDRETAIERGYYDWGRGRPADSPEPEWDTASPGQRRQVSLRGCRLYDGLPVRHGTTRAVGGVRGHRCQLAPHPIEQSRR